MSSHKSSSGSSSSRKPRRSIPRETKTKVVRKETSDISDEKLDELMKEWSKVKRQISDLETREKSIKEFISDIMKDEGITFLNTDNYQVTKRLQKRSTVSQKDLPEEIWKKYSKTSEFPVYYLKRVE